MTDPTRDEANNIHAYLVQAGEGAHATCSTKVCRQLLLQSGGRIIIGGLVRDIHRHSLGAGVHRVSIAPRSEGPAND